MPEIKLFSQCKGGELIKMDIDGSDRFAIVGAPIKGLGHPLLVYSDGVWRLKMVGDVFSLDPAYETATVISFGKPLVSPNYLGRCQFGESGLFVTPGALVFAVGKKYIVAAAEKRQGGIAYADLEDGEVGGPRGGQRVAFSEWSILSLDEQKLDFRVS
jgi:hypothetical protein